MRVIVQRSLESSVLIDGKVNGKINKGFVLLVGFTNGDDSTVIENMANKIVNLRIFSDENDKMNLDIKSVNGSILSISQFTLYGKLTGRRPSFTDALKYDEATILYDKFNEELRKYNIDVQTGIFGARRHYNRMSKLLHPQPSIRSEYRPRDFQAGYGK